MFYFMGGFLEHVRPERVALGWALYLTSLYGTVVNVPTQFLYRYFALCR